MVRLVRIHADNDMAPAGLNELAESGAVDLLQLDYSRPRVSVFGQHPAELPEYAAGFAQAVAACGRSLFLEPDFRIVASAGWSNAYACIERVGSELVARGCSETPISAVRGSNLLPILEFLQRDIPLSNSDTGAPWRDVPQPILAADLQIGAGPLAAAFGEGARVVVAGHYDGASPAIAAAVDAFAWKWNDVNRLAAAAAAARAAAWPRPACDWLAAARAARPFDVHPRIELDGDGRFTVNLSRPCEADDGRHLVEWLRADKQGRAARRHADVHYSSAEAAVDQIGPHQLRVAGCTGSEADAHWRLDVLFQAGYVAEAMIKFDGAGGAMRRQVADAFQTHFVDASSELSLVEIQELTATDAAGPDVGWLHMVCRAKLPRPCHDFVAYVSRLATANPKLIRLPAGSLSVKVECGLWPTRVPRDAIDLAVDTRPAKEWQ